MATTEYETTVDDEDNKGETSQTTKQTVKQTKASPWMLTKAHMKVTAAKKNASKSKRVAGGGGGKARKKSVSKAVLDGDQEEASEGDGRGSRRQGQLASSDDKDNNAASSGTPTDVNIDVRLAQTTVDAIYEEEVHATVNGMKHFGISKGVISRAIVRFSSPPEPHPLSVCFHFPGTFVTHKYVLEMVRNKLQPVSDARVTVIQFVNRNTIHGTQGMDNRWILTMNCDEAKEHLLCHGLTLFNKKIKLRSYDDVLNDEYIEYQEYIQLQKTLYAQKKKATVSGEDEPDRGCSEQENESQNKSEMRVVDASHTLQRHPTTAVNTPEPP